MCAYKNIGTDALAWIGLTSRVAIGLFPRHAGSGARLNRLMLGRAGPLDAFTVPLEPPLPFSFLNEVTNFLIFFSLAFRDPRTLFRAKKSQKVSS